MLKFFATVSGGPRAQKRDLSEEEKQEIAQQKRAREEEHYTVHICRRSKNRIAGAGFGCYATDEDAENNGPCKACKEI